MRYLIVPAAGEGKRFRDAGYTVPKPFLELDGKPLVEHIINAYLDHVDRVLLILRSEDLDHVNILPARLDHRVDIVHIEYMQRGPVLSMLCANGALPDEAEVVIHDCDVVVDKTEVQRWLRWLRKGPAVGLFHEPTGCAEFSYAKIRGGPDEQVVDDIVEKQAVTANALAGLWYAPSWAELRAHLCMAVAQGSDAMVKGEFYMSSVFRDLEPDPFWFNPKDLKLVGTPERYLKVQRASFQ